MLPPGYTFLASCVLFSDSLTYTSTSLPVVREQIQRSGLALGLICPWLVKPELTWLKCNSIKGGKIRPRDHSPPSACLSFKHIVTSNTWPCLESTAFLHFSREAQISHGAQMARQCMPCLNCRFHSNSL